MSYEKIQFLPTQKHSTSPTIPSNNLQVPFKDMFLNKIYNRSKYKKNHIFCYYYISLRVTKFRYIEIKERKYKTHKIPNKIATVNK